MTKFVCSICQKEFNNCSGLAKHISQKKMKCDETVNTDYWVKKQIPKIYQRYNYLKMISNLSDEEMDFEMKKKILKAFYLKVISILKIIDENRNIVPSVSEEDVSKLREYIECCKSGVYN